MIYAYIRVSTEQQTLDNQSYEIKQFCNRNGLYVDHWVMETSSGMKEMENRKLGKLLRKMGQGDILLCAEISRLGRSLLMIMSILHICMKKNLKVWTIKDNFKLGDDIASKVLAFAFALSAEIERNLISQRTKEALARKRSEGIKLGRPAGHKDNKRKLEGKENVICALLEQKESYTAIAKQLKVNRRTVKTFIISKNLEIRVQKN
ncbi:MULTISPECIES: master DNA invertase Mpi family serine-type recombinase [Chitinophagaceae]